MTRSTLEQALGFDIPLIVPIMLILYIAVIMAVGLWAAKKVKNSEDWFVGGRSIGTVDHGTGSRLQLSGRRYVHRRTAVRLGGRSLFSLGSSRRRVRTDLELRHHRQKNAEIHGKIQGSHHSGILRTSV